MKGYNLVTGQQLVYEEFEDTKGVIRIHKSKNDRKDTTPLPLPIINK